MLAERAKEATEIALAENTIKYVYEVVFKEIEKSSSRGYSNVTLEPLVNINDELFVNMLIVFGYSVKETKNCFGYFYRVTW